VCQRDGSFGTLVVLDLVHLVYVGKLDAIALKLLVGPGRLLPLLALQRVPALAKHEVE